MELISREKSVGLTAEESSELEHYLQLEHLMRLAKAQSALETRVSLRNRSPESS